MTDSNEDSIESMVYRVECGCVQVDRNAAYV